MTERPSFWQRLFGGTRTSSLSQRQEKVLKYIINRINEDVPLHDILQEEYVRRNSTQTEREQILSSPKLVEAARERLGESFRSDDIKF
jgi:hypothetical protein